MTKQKELGYELGNVLWHNLEGYQELWNKAEFDTKEKIINELGGLAIKLTIPDVSHLLIAWEQYKKSNWWESEAIDVEKVLRKQFEAIYCG